MGVLMGQGWWQEVLLSRIVRTRRLKYHDEQEG